jgi:hypothetical protein
MLLFPLNSVEKIQAGRNLRLELLGISVETCISLRHQIKNLLRKLQLAITIVDSFSQIYIPWQVAARIILQFCPQDGDTATTFFGIEPDVSGTLSELMPTPLKTSYHNVSQDQVK